MALYLLLSCLPFLSLWESSTGTPSPLGSYIKNYEPLYYDAASVHKVHRRSVERKQTTEFAFTAFGKSHKLHLRPDNRIFTQEVTFENGHGKEIPFDRDAVVHGKVVGDPRSTVVGALDDGGFHGKISTADGDYYIDPSYLHFDKPQDFPSVIYKSEDVEYEYNYPDITKRFPDEARKRRSILNEEEVEHNKDHWRVRRLALSELERNTCPLALYADHYFAELYGSPEKAIRQLAVQLRAVQLIYEKEFNATYPSYGLTFRVSKIVVYDKDDNRAIAADNLGVDTLLDIFSQQNYDDFCEAFLFTNRNFEGGILGLAWIGSTSTDGGICSKNRDYGGGKRRSYNTGLVTMKLYNRFTPPKVSEITFAHELGHGFGSQHDPESCAPGGAGGNFIMYDKATTGDKPNNDKFSSCSKRSIEENVNSKRKRYKKCFITFSEKICGNQIREEDEQCDCGDEETCGQNSCCEPAGSDKQCRLKTGPQYVCDPSQGPCCTKKCQFAGPGTTCKNETGCTKLSKCGGGSFECPIPVPKPNGTSCDERRKICYAGRCSTSVCVKYGLQKCDCTEEKDMCHLCCQKDDTCKRADDWSEVPKELHDVKLVPGTPCANLQGYCDAFEVCRRVNMEGPLLRLTKKYFTKEGVKELVAKYWWAILLGCIGLVIVIALLIKLCAVYTPSHNPDREAKRPARKLPGRRRQPQQQHQPVEMQ